MDEGIGPRTGFELGPGDELPGALDQQGEEVERAAADSNRLTGVKQGLPVRQEPKFAERVRPLGRPVP